MSSVYTLFLLTSNIKIDTVPKITGLQFVPDQFFITVAVFVGRSLFPGNIPLESHILSFTLQ